MASDKVHSDDKCEIKANSEFKVRVHVSPYWVEKGDTCNTVMTKKRVKRMEKIELLNP